MNYLDIWTTKHEEFPFHKPLNDQLLFILKYGVMAPSAHNTQPWKVKLKDSKIIVKLDQESRLLESDKTGRESWIGIGCFVQNIVQSAISFRMACTPVFINKGVDDSAIEIVLKPSKAKDSSEIDKKLLDAILNRRTERSFYSRDKLPTDEYKLIPEKFDEVTVIKVDDNKNIEALAKMSQGAVALAMQIPELRDELREAHTRGAKTHSGIPVNTLGKSYVSAKKSQYKLLFSSAAKDQGQDEYDKIFNSGALLCLFTKGDVVHDWFNAGLAYQNITNRLTMAGINHSTHAALVEAPDFYKDVGEILKTNERLQSLIRIGHLPKPSNSPRTPRKSVKDILT